MDCFSNQHYFIFVKSESHPFITSQSASQNVPGVLHSDSFLNILHKFSFIIKLCHLTLRFPFQTRVAVPWQKPQWIPTFSHFKNSLKMVLLIQFFTSVLFYQMFSFIKCSLLSNEGYLYFPMPRHFGNCMKLAHSLTSHIPAALQLSYKNHYSWLLGSAINSSQFDHSEK